MTCYLAGPYCAAHILLAFFLLFGSDATHSVFVGYAVRYLPLFALILDNSSLFRAALEPRTSTSSLARDFTGVQHLAGLRRCAVLRIISLEGRLFADAEGVPDRKLLATRGASVFCGNRPNRRLDVSHECIRVHTS